MTPQEYLDSHTLNEVFVTQKLGWRTKDKQIVIPIYDNQGILLHCRYRHLDGSVKFTNDKGAHPSLYCSHKIKNLSQVVLAEGEPDVARLWQETKGLK